MLKVHSLLAAQIGHQLRLKVLQQLEILAESLRCTPQGSCENLVLRRFTRSEWAEIKTTGRITQPGAVAVLVVPPLNKRTALEDSQMSSRVLPTLPPVSVLHGTQVVEPTSLSTSQVPLYNGLSLFPCPTLRSKLHKALQTTLLVERRARWRQNINTPDSPACNSADERSREKSSHAYLLRSDGKTIRRADSVPLAISLWRIRMWEGQGWETSLGSYGGWAGSGICH